MCHHCGKLLLTFYIKPHLVRGEESPFDVALPVATGIKDWQNCFIFWRLMCPCPPPSVSWQLSNGAQIIMKWKVILKKKPHSLLLMPRVLHKYASSRRESFCIHMYIMGRFILTKKAERSLEVGKVGKDDGSRFLLGHHQMSTVKLRFKPEEKVTDSQLIVPKNDWV